MPVYIFYTFYSLHFSCIFQAEETRLGERKRQIAMANKGNLFITTIAVSHFLLYKNERALCINTCSKIKLAMRIRNESDGGK